MATIKNLIAISILLSSIVTEAQDYHFSQFDHLPMMINPALTGGIRGDQRATIIYRNQWTSVGAPFKTYAFSGDMNVFKYKTGWKKNYLGLGLNVLRDVAGDTKMSETMANVSLSSFIQITRQHTISAGIQSGFYRQDIDFTKFIWDNESNMDFSFDPSSFNAFTKEEISAGINWVYLTDEQNLNDNDEVYFSLGAAVHHTSRPLSPFTSSGLDKRHLKVTVHGDLYYSFKGREDALTGTFMFMRQGPNTQTLMGAMYRFRFRQASKITGFIKGIAVSGGLNYRLGDAIIPKLLIEVDNFALGIAYDITVSSLTGLNQAKGGIELSLRFINPNPFEFRLNGKKRKRYDLQLEPEGS